MTLITAAAAHVRSRLVSWRSVGERTNYPPWSYLGDDLRHARLVVVARCGQGGVDRTRPRTARVFRPSVGQHRNGPPFRPVPTRVSAALETGMVAVNQGCSPMPQPRSGASSTRDLAAKATRGPRRVHQPEGLRAGAAVSASAPFLAQTRSRAVRGLNAAHTADAGHCRFAVMSGDLTRGGSGHVPSVGVRGGRTERR
jgi:hypothetical protein